MAFYKIKKREVNRLNKDYDYSNAEAKDYLKSLEQVRKRPYKYMSKDKIIERLIELEDHVFSIVKSIRD